MEPFQTKISITVFLGLILATLTLFVIVILMGADIYKKINNIGNYC